VRRHPQYPSHPQHRVIVFCTAFELRFVFRPSALSPRCSFDKVCPRLGVSVNGKAWKRNAAFPQKKSCKENTLARRMAERKTVMIFSIMALHIGTSGWSYPAWKPAFYPEKLPQKKFLEFYSTQLNAVELNATFRRFATASSLKSWIDATTPDFRFAAKSHQIITHFKRLKDAADPLRTFLQSMEPMRQSGKLGPILFQTPPNLHADPALLKEFVQLLPRAYQFAFEFRHESWFEPELLDILKEGNAALCWAESEKIKAPNVVTSNFLYYRFRETDYQQEQLKKIGEELLQRSKDMDVFAFFKHEESPESAVNAVTVSRQAGIEAKPFAMPEKTRTTKTKKKVGE